MRDVRGNSKNVPTNINTGFVVAKLVDWLIPNRLYIILNNQITTLPYLSLQMMTYLRRSLKMMT
jgi:hypothetical protein